jgi:hypothetical protein
MCLHEWMFAGALTWLLKIRNTNEKLNSLNNKNSRAKPVK